MTLPNPECQPLRIPNLPAETCAVLRALLAASIDSLGDDLVAVILYGSAAEGRLRATSDINLLYVLAGFTRTRVDALREPLRVARAAAEVKAMFVTRDELPRAAEAFAMKFADIAHRHLVLYGPDVVAELAIARDAKLARVRQVLLNIAIRLRERYVMTSLRQEQLALVLADMAGPLRVAAATLLEIAGTPAPSAKEALATLAAALEAPEWQQTLEAVSRARETRLLPPGVAADTCFRVIDLTEALRRHAEGM